MPKIPQYASLLAGFLLALKIVPAWPANADSKVPAKIPDVKKETASVVWRSASCEGGAESALASALIAALVPKAIDYGMTFFTKKLEDKADSFKVTHSGKASEVWGGVAFSETQVGKTKRVTANMTLDLQCLIFYSGNAGKWNSTGTRKKLTEEQVLVEKSFYPANIASLPYKPAIYMMSEIDYEPVGQRGAAFRVVPLKLAINSNTSSGSSPKDLIATFKFSVPSVVSGKEFASEVAMPPIQDIKAGDKIEFDAQTSEWISFPVPSPKEGEKSINILGSVQVDILETDTGEGSNIYRALQETLEENRSKITAGILEDVGLKPEEQKAAK